MTTLSARDFNRDVSAAKRAAADGPVMITDRGEPAYVLLAIDDYRRLVGGPADLASWLSMEDDIEFDPEPLPLGLRVPDL